MSDASSSVVPPVNTDAVAFLIFRAPIGQVLAVGSGQCKTASPDAMSAFATSVLLTAVMVPAALITIKNNAVYPAVTVWPSS